MVRYYLIVKSFMACFGVLSIYAAFLYEDRERRVQSILEDSWVRLHDTRTTALSLQAAFMREVARLISRAFDYLFGKELLSSQVVTISVTYSAATFSLVQGLFLSRDYWWVSQIKAAVMLLLAALLFIIGPVFARRSKGRTIYLTLAILFSLSVMVSNHLEFGRYHLAMGASVSVGKSSILPLGAYCRVCV
jgi:hypothetical protein